MNCDHTLWQHMTKPTACLSGINVKCTNVKLHYNFQNLKDTKTGKLLFVLGTFQYLHRGLRLDTEILRDFKSLFLQPLTEEQQSICIISSEHTFQKLPSYNDTVTV